MNKADIIENVAEKLNTSKADAGRAVDAVIDTITDGLKKGESVAFVKFGTFIVKDRAARKGRNPHTGAEIDIPAAKVLSFKAGKPLKDEVNSK